jgi:hypothetical protein
VSLPFELAELCVWVCVNALTTLWTGAAGGCYVAIGCAYGSCVMPEGGLRVLLLQVCSYALENVLHSVQPCTAGVLWS